MQAARYYKANGQGAPDRDVGYRRVPSYEAAEKWGDAANSADSRSRRRREVEIRSLVRVTMRKSGLVKEEHR